MPDAREIMDVYLGSDEEEQFDLWLSNRELRTQFDAVDHLVWKRGKRTLPRGKSTSSRGTRKFWRKLSKNHPWPVQM